jgi:hypothetical protein
MFVWILASLGESRLPTAMADGFLAGFPSASVAMARCQLTAGFLGRLFLSWFVCHTRRAVRIGLLVQSSTKVIVFQQCQSSFARADSFTIYQAYPMMDMSSYGIRTTKRMRTCQKYTPGDFMLLWARQKVTHRRKHWSSYANQEPAL